MLSDIDMQDIMNQLQRGMPVEQAVREYALSNLPMPEQYCSLLPEAEQIPTLKKLVRIEAEHIAVCGIETLEQLGEFLGVLECYRKNSWIDDGELETVLFEVRRWIEGNDRGERRKVDESEAALMRIAVGLSHRMF